MIRILLTAPALCLALCGATLAQAPNNPLYKGGFQYHDMGATPPTNDSLYKALGGTENITAFTTEFVGLVSKDGQIGHYFTHIDLDRLRRELIAQFIELSGGPGKYTGLSMAQAHSSLGITNADFDRLAEDLEVAMNHHDVGFATQDRLLALLASMQRVIVTK